ncbi:MAG: hypothetical protein ABSA40_05900 [Candidatus Dormibacteria bacterium]
MSDTYTIERTPAGNNVVVIGDWTPGAAVPLMDGRADGLVLNYAKGFKSGGSLDFMTSDLPVARLYLLDRGIEDPTPIANLGQHLCHVSLAIAPGVELDLKLTPNVRSVAAAWPAIEKSVRFAGGLEVISTTKYDATDLLPVCTHTSLRILQIKEAPELETLMGLSSLRDLETLRLMWAVRLHDISALCAVAETLTELRMERCRAVKSLNDVGQLTNLRSLEFSDGSEVPSLAPLARLEKLETLHLWGTTHPVNNDLSPLVNLKHLRDFRMKSRREYQPPVAEIRGARVTGR